MSGTLSINGIDFKLPKKPAKKDILFSNKAKKNQKWERTKMPDGMSEDTAGKFSWFIEQEFERRKNGVWFMNNGVPTYITGSHYMYLQWTSIDVGYPDYREANRIFFLFWEACRADKRSFGMTYLKIRRSIIKTRRKKN